MAKKDVEYDYTYVTYKDVSEKEKAKKDVEYAYTYTPYTDIEKKEKVKKNVSTTTLM